MKKFVIALVVIIIISLAATGVFYYLRYFGSNITDNLQNVAFKTPAGKTVLIVVNGNSAAKLFNIKSKGKIVSTELAAGSVATYVW